MVAYGVTRMIEQIAKAPKQVQVLKDAPKTSGRRMKQLIHNGVLIPDAYAPQGFTLTFRGSPLKLTPLQEEMAVKFAQKFGTPYTEDPTFCSNFMKDFAEAIGTKEKISVADFDWTPITRWIEAERARKANMSKEERKRLAAARKKLREERKERYGWATVDGVRMEIGNYAVEPASVFMGRGCLSGDTITKTIDGPKYVRELVPGDRIASHRGSDHMPYGRIQFSTPQGVRDFLELRTRTHSIRATSNHPFLRLGIWKTRRRSSKGKFTNERYRPELRWEKLADLRSGDHVVVVKKYAEEGTRRYSNQAIRTVGNTIITPRFAQVLGYFIGDGCFSRRAGKPSGIILSEGNPKRLDEYRRLCEQAFGVAPTISRASKGTSWKIHVNSAQLAEVLLSLDLTDGALHKRIPAWAFRLADDLKDAFLRGYFEADGTVQRVSINGTEYLSVAAESPNKRLVEDLRELCTSAGLKVSNLTSRVKTGLSGRPSRSFRFAVSEYASTKRLITHTRLRGRTRNYLYRQYSLRRTWDWSKLQILDSKYYTLEKVLSVRKAGRAQTFDVSMTSRRTPNFIANGFVVHNSHPMRGRWKPAVTTEDVTLNLSPDAPMPPGKWAGREWRPDELWVAKWTDKLSDKVKYIWFHDATPMKQERAQEKFDLAGELESKIDMVRAHIAEGLRDKDVKRRKVATVAYLIDVFKIRVGDEKETESGTVGATSLQSKHITLHTSPFNVKLHFFGKDWILFERELPVSEDAFRNLKDFTAEGGRIFSGVTTEAVREFLSEAMPKLSPKVFRTFSATHLFREKLSNAKVGPDSAETEKKMALTEANAAVAQLLNHQKAIPKKWQETYKKRLEMLKSLKRKKGKSIAKRKLGLQFRIAQMRLGKKWNLGTSLRNYIDPRVSVEFCKRVNYDWKAYYPKSLITKFAWAEA
jgi:intein/homing endonuclease